MTIYRLIRLFNSQTPNEIPVEIIILRAYLSVRLFFSSSSFKARDVTEPTSFPFLSTIHGKSMGHCNVPGQNIILRLGHDQNLAAFQPDLVAPGTPFCWLAPSLARLPFLPLSPLVHVGYDDHANVSRRRDDDGEGGGQKFGARPRSPRHQRLPCWDGHGQWFAISGILLNSSSLTDLATPSDLHELCFFIPAAFLARLRVT